MGVLQGVRVLELAAVGPAPFCCALLADMGAEIITVTAPDRPVEHFGEAADPVWRGRAWIQCDLKSAAGQQRFHALASQADMLVEGFRPGVLERLGIAPETLLATNPALVIGRMSGWGQDGPMARVAGHDPNYLALTGALSLIGPKDAPAMPLNLVGDFGGGALFLALGLVTALRHAERTGEGQVVDAAIIDGVSAMLSMVHYLRGSGLWRDERGANMIDGGAPHAGVYETADGRHLVVAAAEDKFYAAFVAQLGLNLAALPDRHDPANWLALRAMICDVIRGQTLAEWQALFDGTDCCVSPVLSAAEAVSHPHAVARQAFCRRDGISVPAPAPRFGRTPSILAPEGGDLAARLALWGMQPGAVQELLP